MWKLQESTKKSGTSRGDGEKIMWNFHGSWFSTLEFPSDVTQFCRFSSGESIVFWNFHGYSDKSKNSSFFFYVYVQAPLLLRFFLEYPVKVSGSSLKAFLEQQYLKAFKLSHNDKIHGLNKKIKQTKKKILYSFTFLSSLYRVPYILIFKVTAKRTTNYKQRKMSCLKTNYKMNFFK